MDDVIAKLELPRRRRFTWEEYHRMGETGILRPGERVELIEGDIIQMAPIGSRHMACVVELNRRLVPAIGDRALLWPQGPVRLPLDTEPEPDVALMRPRADRYAHASAHPEDVLLLIEVAESSYRYDRGVKLALYARSAIPETWIVNLVRDRIEIFQDPGPSGYASTSIVEFGGQVSPAAFPDIVLAVDDALLAH